MTTTSIPAETARPDTSRHLLSVLLNVASTFIISVSMGMCAILFPVTLERMGVGTSMIGGIMALETIAALGICFLLPTLLRYMGMRVGLIASTLIRVPPLLLLGFQSSVPFWVVAVFLHGVGTFSFLIFLQTWVNSIPFRRNKGLMVALYSTAISLGLAAGPVVLRFTDDLSHLLLPAMDAGMSALGLADMASASQTEVMTQIQFFAAALISMVALLPVSLGLWLVPHFTFTGKARIIGTILSAKGPMFAVAMGGVSIFGVTAFITLYGLRNDMSLENASLLLSFFMLGALFLETPITWLSDYLDRRYVIVAASFLSMLCAVLLPIVIYVPWQAWALLFVWGGFIGAIYSTALALIGDRFEGEELVAANAGYATMDAVGGTAGILLIGYLMNVLGSDGLPYVIMFASIVYFSFALTRYRVV